MSHLDESERLGAMAVEYVAHKALVPDSRNTRKHPKAQLVKLEASIREFGFNAPILIDEDNKVIAGHARLVVAQALGMGSIPCVRVTHLSAVQRRALSIADNRIAEQAEWDPEALKAEFAALCTMEFPLELTGFATAEIDIILDAPLVTMSPTSDPADVFAPPDRSAPAASLPGDCWLLGNHRLYCGNALELQSYEEVLGGHRAAMVITDPPFNVSIQGHVSGLGKAAHREFAMASGEMSPDEFTNFLRQAMDLMVRFSTDGSIHFIFMDWRHIREITTAGAAAYSEFKALCVWNKTNGGMGSLYRSKHELVFVYKNGTAPHCNNVQLGKYGRYRTNVWDYAGANAFGRDRDTDLASHPTTKSVALIADAIRDCSKRGDVILDPFAGSGTILLAAERTGRKAAAIELDPHYVDTAIKRWQEAVGAQATLSNTGQTFAEVTVDRGRNAIPPSALHGEADDD
ncbi:MAG: ParB N-terminal domain-containing protein [Sphingomonas sp.]|nr:ParB N-terminal domain-containing protein [Sphingomonas sp.]